MTTKASRMLEDSPIIAAIKNDDDLALAVKSDCKIIFILYGTVCTIAQIVATIKEVDKIAMVHLDLIVGLASKEVSVSFIKEFTKADGIISTKPALVKFAKELDFITVQRVFMIDSIAMENCKKYIKSGTADMVEIMPATMPKIIKRMAVSCKVPIIAGGLISDKEDVMLALQAGAMGVSSTNHDVWKM